MALAEWALSKLAVVFRGALSVELSCYSLSGVPLWLEWCQHAIGLSYVAGEVQETREIFEMALAAQGLNFAKGALLFEVYRELENLHLTQLQKVDKDALSVQTPPYPSQHCLTLLSYCFLSLGVAAGAAKANRQSLPPPVVRAGGGLGHDAERIHRLPHHPRLGSRP